MNRERAPFAGVAVRGLGWVALAVGLVTGGKGVAVEQLAEHRLVIVTPHNEAIRFEFARGFSEWHRRTYGEPVEVEWRDVGGTSDALRFVQSEFARKPAGIGIDLFFGGGSEPYLLLAERGYAARVEVDAPVLAGIPQRFNAGEVYDRGFRWYGVALSSFGILQNLEVQRRIGLPRVSRWRELAEPGLRGWVGVGDPRNSGTMNIMFEAFLQAYGWEEGWALLTRIAGNVRRFDRVSSTTAKDVTLGETAYAFAIDFYAYSQIAAAGRTQLSFVLPADFTAVSPDGLAVLRGAPHAELARRFVEYALSEAGQKLWFLPRGYPEGPVQYSIERMSVRPDFYQRYRGISAIEMSPFEVAGEFRYDAKLARERREVVAALVGALLVDVHVELKRAWGCLIESGLPAGACREFGNPGVTESEAAALAAGPWRDPGTRNRMTQQWQQWAQRKYRGLVESPGAASQKGVSKP